MRRILLAVVVLVVAVGPAAAETPSSDMALLLQYMTGSFSSEAQAASDEDFRDIRLHMVPIWTERADGHWLYVEQAVAEAQERPYRQRVYHLTEIAPGLFQSRVLTFPEPLERAGAWQAERPLADLGPADLSERDGCAILMRRRGDEFIGSTLGRLCTSSLRGASYATSEVVISAAGLETWDRGFDAAGTQVWGAEKSGYVFARVEPAEPR